MADACGVGYLTQGVARVACCDHGGPVLGHGGSAPLLGALHAGEKLHLEQVVGAIQQRLRLVHPALILKAERLVNQVVGERDWVVGVRVDVLLGMRGALTSLPSADGKQPSEPAHPGQLTLGDA